MASNWQADFERGVQLMSAQQYAEARELLEKSWQAQPEQALIGYSLAVACAQTQDAPRAIELLQGLEKRGELTAAGKNLLNDLLGKSNNNTSSIPTPPGGLKLNFNNTNTTAPANNGASEGLKLNFGAPGGLKLNFGAPASEPVQAIDCGSNPAQMYKMLRSMEKTGELTDTGRQMLNDLLAKHPELNGVAPANNGTPGGLQLNFGSPAPAASAGGLKLNFGAPAAPANSPAPGGLQLNFNTPAGNPQPDSRQFSPALPAFTNRFGPGTIVRIANNAKTWKEIFKFAKDSNLPEETVKFYHDCHADFGDSWYYADTFTMTYAASKCAQPQNYLDLGTGKGSNLAAALRACPRLNFIACENWDEAGLNAARDFAVAQKGTGKGKFMQGAPAVMVPKMFQANPDLKFDVITIDNQPAADVEAILGLALPHLNIGGVVILGAINRDPQLTQAWRNAMGRVGGMVGVEYCETGVGAAVAVKVF